MNYQDLEKRYDKGLLQVDGEPYNGLDTSYYTILYKGFEVALIEVVGDYVELKALSITDGTLLDTRNYKNPSEDTIVSFIDNGLTLNGL